MRFIPRETVGVKDIHDEVLRISGKLDVIGERNRTADRLHNDHEKRLRALEKWRYALPVSTLTSGVAILVAVYSQLKGG